MTLLRHVAPRSLWVLGCLALSLPFTVGAASESNRTQRAFRYTHDQDAAMPWSMHIVRIQRGHPGLQLQTTLGRTNQFGMGLISDQARSVTADEGQAVAAINGDFYTSTETHPGRPRDLQIRNGELLTDPDGHACFWIDPDGNPRMTNVHSRLRVAWSGGGEIPIGLNEPRESDTAVLYSSAIGPSTRTQAGLDLLLAPAEGSPWLPLRPGARLEAVVRSVQPEGDALVPTHGLVLSLGPRLVSRLPRITLGTRLTLLTETIPDLSGVQTAIGGGPALVVEGRPMEWSWLTPRHPRSAIGWNDEALFLVEVDGRQAGLSVGMSFPELAAYMIRLGCRNAMNLDGGGSSTLWVLGNVINSPSEGRERPAANALVVVEKRSTSRDADRRMESAAPSATEGWVRSPSDGKPLREEAFLEGSPVPIALEIDPAAMEQLRLHPREAVRATLRSGDESHAPIAVRLKGSTGSFRSLDDKPSFTVDFARYDPARRFHGLRRIYLNNSVEDPSYLHEQLGAEIFRAHGIPAPRVSHARVQLNGRSLGVYVLKEGFTEDFLARHFRRADGLLCDNDHGSDVDQPLHQNLPDAPDPESTHRTAVATDLAAAAQEPDLARRWARLDSVLDLDRFLTFTVLEVMLGHRDGYGLARNNFRLYRDPEAGRWTFLPDGMDQLFGLADFPWQPHMSGLVAASLLETPEGRKRYTTRFIEVLDDVFRKPSLPSRVERLAAALRPGLSWAERSAFDREVRGLLERIERREQALRRQIAEFRAGAPSPGPSALGTANPRTHTPL